MSLHSAYRLGVPMKLANLVVGQAWFDAHQLYLDARDTPPAALLAPADLLEWLPGWGTIRWRLSNAWLAAAYAHLETECAELYRVELAAEYQDNLRAVIRGRAIWLQCAVAIQIESGSSGRPTTAHHLRSTRILGQ
jgi:hypothetical protein